MSDMDYLYWALIEARRTVDALSTWVKGVDAYDSIRNRRRVIQDGFDAHERLSRLLREGRMHVEIPDDYKRTSCGCQDPGASPPCSWCTDPENDPDKEEA